MDNEDLAHRSVRFQDAQAMCHQGQFGQRRDAAVIAEMAPSTFTHRMAGRRSVEDYDKYGGFYGARGINFAAEIRDIAVFWLATNPS